MLVLPGLMLRADESDGSCMDENEIIDGTEEEDTRSIMFGSMCSWGEGWRGIRRGFVFWIFMSTTKVRLPVITLLLLR